MRLNRIVQHNTTTTKHKITAAGDFFKKFFQKKEDRLHHIISLSRAPPSRCTFFAFCVRIRPHTKISKTNEHLPKIVYLTPRLLIVKTSAFCFCFQACTRFYVNTRIGLYYIIHLVFCFINYYNMIIIVLFIIT